MKLLLIAAFAALALTEIHAGPVKIDECTCFEKGNFYTPVSRDNCDSFTQRTDFLPPETHNCPPGLKFDLNVCVCNWPSQVTCPANCPAPAQPHPPSTVSCERNGNIYATVPGTHCSEFTQATATLPPITLRCPAGLQFDVVPCVCNWPHDTVCHN